MNWHTSFTLPCPTKWKWIVKVRYAECSTNLLKFAIFHVLLGANKLWKSEVLNRHFVSRVQHKLHGQTCWMEHQCIHMLLIFYVWLSPNGFQNHMCWMGYGHGTMSHVLNGMVMQPCHMCWMGYGHATMSHVLNGLWSCNHVTCAEWAMVMQPCLPLLYLVECEYFRKSDVLHKVAPYPYVVLFLPCSVNVLYFGSEYSCEENNVFKFTFKSLFIIQGAAS
jgi:hypothetical protein